MVVEYVELGLVVLVLFKWGLLGDIVLVIGLEVEVVVVIDVDLLLFVDDVGVGWWVVEWLCGGIW